jgi:hypothetical protein
VTWITATITKQCENFLRLFNQGWTIVQRMYKAVSIVVCLSVWGGMANGADLVVVRAEGVSLHAGDLIPGNQVLRLDAGQKASLITPSGKIIRLSGPYDQVPLPEGTGDDPSAIGSLKSMVKERTTNTASLGITRASETELPEPWVIDVGSSGERCIVEGQHLVLWRPDGQSNLPLTLSTKSGAWRANAVWPAGKQKLKAPSDLALADGDVLTVQFEKGAASLTAMTVPASLTTDAMRLAWLLEKGCLSQATALASRLK